MHGDVPEVRAETSTFSGRRRGSLRARYLLCWGVAMPIALQHEEGNVHRLDVTGVLRKQDFERCQASLLEQMRRGGSVRLLFVLKNFEGWDARDDWRDLTFYVRHGDAIERIAIVGDERWRSESLMFAGADLRRAPVEFFPSDDVSGARAWLSS